MPAKPPWFRTPEQGALQVALNALRDIARNQGADKHSRDLAIDGLVVAQRHWGAFDETWRPTPQQARLIAEAERA